ncbi:unnamed protein product [Bursaphelenchus okinawaensis]|uniref:Large ribosomal subunit protein mL51 n=1 Tax=Bursaphelenchus okinawaensis TaxID=465554 RepID=A0A811L910_9BILA|nr:unnamed protein product [Bursaphelenchus okinawaensis]CAG9120223.1 unnamed protein product [Bursaphelenchus okinawaensis]
MLKLLSCRTSTSAISRTFRDIASVPRVSDDHEKRMHKPVDTGYFFRYHRQGVDALPRVKDSRDTVCRPKYKVRDAWSNASARYGENDYIDLLKKEANVHPAQLQYHVPRWLRGFPGQQKANELVKLIHYRNIYKEKMQKNSPHQWHALCKQINHLLQYHNYKKADELREERRLGLWKQEPDYFWKDKSRRSYKDLV